MGVLEGEESCLSLDEKLLRFMDQLELLEEKRSNLNSLIEQVEKNYRMGPPTFSSNRSLVIGIVTKYSKKKCNMENYECIFIQCIFAPMDLLISIIFHKHVFLICTYFSAYFIMNSE